MSVLLSSTRLNIHWPRSPHQTVLLVDDHILVRQGLRSVLEQARSHLTLLEAGSVHEAMALLRDGGAVDLVLLDILLPGINGLDGLQLLRPLSPSASMAIMSGQSDSATISRSLALGADGFIAKTLHAREFVHAVTRLLNGERYFPALALEPSDSEPAQRRHALTARQLEILSLLADGSPNKVIAEKLSITENTVRGHVSALLDHFGVNNRTSAIHMARQQGLLR